MSLEIAFYSPDDDRHDEDAGYHFYLSTNHAWLVFIEWATALAEARYPVLYRLCNDGEALDTEALRDDIKRALRTEPFDDPVIAHTGKHLFRVIRRGDPEESAVVES